MQPNERNELARGQDAQAALDNPLIAEALSAWEKEVTEAWKNSPLRDVEGRERLRLMLEASRQFTRHLQTTIDTGKLQSVSIQRKQTVLEKVKGWAA